MSAKEGTPVRKATSLLFRLLRREDAGTGPGWWEYFGSFGDDIFGDVEANDA